MRLMGHDAHAKQRVSIACGYCCSNSLGESTSIGKFEFSFPSITASLRSLILEFFVRLSMVISQLRESLDKSSTSVSLWKARMNSYTHPQRAENQLVNR